MNTHNDTVSFGDSFSRNWEEAAGQVAANVALFAGGATAAYVALKVIPPVIDGIGDVLEGLRGDLNYWLGFEEPTPVPAPSQEELDRFFQKFLDDVRAATINTGERAA